MTAPRTRLQLRAAAPAATRPAATPPAAAAGPDLLAQVRAHAEVARDAYRSCIADVDVEAELAARRNLGGQ
jgi:hypothetical protein